jgi:hypothetical protein
MTRLHEDGTAFFTKGLVKTHVRASNPRSFGIPAVFIFKHTFYHKDFFTAKMPMGIEVRLWCPLD